MRRCVDECRVLLRLTSYDRLTSLVEAVVRCGRRTDLSAAELHVGLGGDEGLVHRKSYDHGLFENELLRLSHQLDEDSVHPLPTSAPVDIDPFYQQEHRQLERDRHGRRRHEQRNATAAPPSRQHLHVRYHHV